MSISLTKLEKLKTNLKQYQTQNIELKAEKNILLKTLEKDFNCKSVSEGKDLIAQVEESLLEQESTIEKEYNLLLNELKQAGLIP